MKKKIISFLVENDFIYDIARKLYERGRIFRLHNRLKNRDDIQKNANNNILSINKENKNAIILGNGPSLKEVLDNGISRFELDDAFCVNEFAQTEFYHQIRPKYYVILDPAYGEHETPLLDIVLETREAIEKKTKWPIILFLPERMRKWNHLQRINNDYIIIKYMNVDNPTFEYEEEEFYRARYNVNFLSECGQNVLHAAIYLAIIIGYEEISIMGADHSLHKDLIVDQESNELFIEDRHFYDNKKSPIRPLFGFNMKTILQSCYNTMRGHYQLKRFSEYMGKKIYLIGFSFIDCYERKYI